MATDLNITMKQYNGVDYDTLYPKTIIEQIDGLSDSYFTKNQTLKSSTAVQFGLGPSAVPDDALSYLGQYAEHWWEYARPAHDEYSVSMANLAGTDQFFVGGTIYVSKEVTVDDNGKVTLVAPISCYNNDENSDHMKQTFETIKNNIPCYISPSESMHPYGTTDIFVYVPTGATVTVATQASTYTVYQRGYCVAFNASASVLAKVCTLDKQTIAAGTALYAHSTDRNAYPDSGEVEGVTYKYLGIPLEQTPGIPLRAKIETGSYTGSGATTKTLTFSFKPMAVFIGIATDNRFLSPMVYGQSEAVGTNTGSGRYGLSLTWSDKSLTITSDDDDRGADYFNFNGKEHTYVAIG